MDLQDVKLVESGTAVIVTRHRGTHRWSTAIATADGKVRTGSGRTVAEAARAALANTSS